MKGILKETFERYAATYSGEIESIDSIKQFMADATLNHTVAEVFAEDTKQLNRMVKLWTDAFKGAAMSEVQSITKENTDTESSGGVKYSLTEKELVADVKKR